METKTFVLIGAAGYIAPKHFQAIKQIGGKLIAVIDPVDNLDVLDEYFPDSEYFKTTEEAKPFMEKNKVDYFVVCTPSHLHVNHIIFGLSHNSDIICESPLILSLKELEQIKKQETKTKRKVYTILQYRFDPAIIKLKQEFDPTKHSSVLFKNHSYRGKWLQQSWKGDPEKTGGLLTVLGYHFFDALMWIYGQPSSLQVAECSKHSISGKIQLKHATISFDLSNKTDDEDKENALFLSVNNHQINLTAKDANLFKITYSKILNQKGLDIEKLNNIHYLLEKN